MFLGEIKLSKILSHNFDKGSDRLYQPLRTAIQTLSSPPNQPKQSIQSSTAHQTSLAKGSGANISKDLIMHSTFIPINKKLVQTNNPEKKQKARSNSYRTLSVEQRVGSPIAYEVFQQSINNAGKKFEIVYDYDAAHNSAMSKEHLKPAFATLTSTTMPRTRSVTYVGISSESLVNRVQKGQMRTKIQRTGSSTSIHFALEKQGKEKASKKSEQIGQYYEECKRYAFNKKASIKRSSTNLSNSKSQSIMKRSNLFQNQYKYNLFNILDRPINTQCQGGFCHKNAIVAPKIKKRW